VYICGTFNWSSLRDVNMCEQPQLVINGQIVSTGGDFTANGPTSGIACVFAFFETTTEYPHLLIRLFPLY
jgi:hypothetical protein